MELVFATNNKHKVSELRKLFQGYFGDKVNILTLKDVGFEGDIIEDADTFEGNAFIKADTVCRFCGKPAVADDSGLVVDALDGAPGVMSARYSGADADDIKNINKLLKELENVEYTKRTARFVCHICCVFPDGSEPIVVQGRIDGEILTEARGEGGFGYDPLFWVESHRKSFAEMSSEEKNVISHRARALEKFSEKFT